MNQERQIIQWFITSPNPDQFKKVLCVTFNMTDLIWGFFMWGTLSRSMICDLGFYIPNCQHLMVIKDVYD